MSGPSAAWSARWPRTAVPSSGTQDSIHWSRCTADPSRTGDASTRAHAATRASCSSGPRRAKLCPRTDSTAVTVRARSSTTTPNPRAWARPRWSPSAEETIRSPSNTDNPGARGRPGGRSWTADGAVPSPGTSTTIPRPGPGSGWNRCPRAPAHAHRASTGSHCSPVRPATGQNATATELPTRTTATTTPGTDGRLRTVRTATTSPAATTPTCPPRQPAMTPRRSSGGNR